jgi:DNA-binding FadR family transcriptional regulator
MGGRVRPDVTAADQRKLSRAQRIAAEIEAEILADRMPMGTRLGLRTDLIDRFEASPPVMNEALRILRERDLVTVRPGPNGGVMVASLPPQLRLGGIDVWHQGLTAEPEKLFEARSQLAAEPPPPGHDPHHLNWSCR